MRRFLYLALVLILILEFSTWGKTDETKPVKSGIALTYANDVMTDGAGAQLQRIYGIYAVSRYLHVPYIHTPLKSIGYQGLAALEKNAVDPNLQDKYNRVFVIPSDIKLPADAITKYIASPKVADIESLRSEAEKENKFYLLKMLFPYDITEKDPEIYRCLKDISPFKSTPSRTFRIAIHVRRGEEFVVESSRMLPNSYYVNSTLRIVHACQKMAIPFVCELYTEVPSKAFVVTPQHHGLEGNISKPAVIDPKMNRIEDFNVIPNLHKFINTDPIEAMKGMATADALIISRSTFSYLPALFGHGIVVYSPMMHHPLKEWLVADSDGNLPSQKLFEQLIVWKRAHR